MKFRTLKAALGWYAARCHGPKMQSQRLEPRVQSSRILGDLQHMEIAKVLASVPDGVRAQILEWGSVSDEACDVSERAGRELRRVARELRRLGLLSEPVRPAKTEVVEFVDENTGAIHRMKRTVDR